MITTKGILPENLNNYQCGWWIDLSVSNLRTALLNALNTSNVTVEIMGANWKKLVKGKYEMKATWKKMLDLYHKIIN